MAFDPGQLNPDPDAPGVPAEAPDLPPPAAEAPPEPDQPAPPPEPEAAAPAPLVDAQPGQLYTWARHDDYASPPRVRHMILLVVAVGDGGAQVVQLGYADELPTLPLSALAPLGELDS